MSDKINKKLVIIGSGPAGLTAGIYAARSNLNPLIIDGPTPGGQLMSTSYVENWPGEKKIAGPKLITHLRDQAAALGCIFLPESIKTINTSVRPFTLITDKQKNITTEAIIVATGAKPKRLGCPGENTYWGKGVSSCAICDGTFYQNKHVVIVGGGDTAMENASFMTTFTNKITIVHILDKLTASPAMQKRVLKNPAINVIYNSAITQMRGNSKHLQEIIIRNNKTNKEQIIPTDGVFVSIGLQPNTEFLKNTLELDKWGYVKVWQHKDRRPTSTSVEGIFAAGDVFDYLYKQAITASGSGCMAALDAAHYLENQTKN